MSRSSIEALRKAHADLQRAYELWELGAGESASDEVNRLPRRSRGDRAQIRSAETIGKLKWAQSVKAQAVIDDQKFAERRIGAYGALLVIDALADIYEVLAEIRDTLRSRS